MLKVVLGEARTIPVTGAAINKATAAFSGAFLRLVLDYLNKRLVTAPLSTAARNKYKELIEKIITKHGDVLKEYRGYKQGISVDDVQSGVSVIDDWSTKELINDIVAWKGLRDYFPEDLSLRAIKARLNKHFKSLGYDKVHFVLEFKKPETNKERYGGLYSPEELEIIIAYERSLFFSSSTESDGIVRKLPAVISPEYFAIDTIMDRIAEELKRTRTLVRHEFQHLFQNMLSGAPNTKSYGVGLPPETVYKQHRGRTKYGDLDYGNLPHFMDPAEMQTDTADEIDKLKRRVAGFIKNNKKLLRDKAVKKFAKRLIVKAFLGNALSDEERTFMKRFSTSSETFAPSELLKQVKSHGHMAKLEKYIRRVIYNALEKHISESIDINNASDITVIIR